MQWETHVGLKRIFWPCSRLQLQTGRVTRSEREWERRERGEKKREREKKKKFLRCNREKNSPKETREFNDPWSRARRDRKKKFFHLVPCLSSRSLMALRENEETVINCDFNGEIAFWATNDIGGNSRLWFANKTKWLILILGKLLGFSLIWVSCCIFSFHSCLFSQKVNIYGRENGNFSLRW